MHHPVRVSGGLTIELPVRLGLEPAPDLLALPALRNGSQGGDGGKDDHQGDGQLGDPRPGHEAQFVCGDSKDRTHPAAASPNRR